jgi:hypothetical protein
MSHGSMLWACGPGICHEDCACDQVQRFATIRTFLYRTSRLRTQVAGIRSAGDGERSHRPGSGGAELELSIHSGDGAFGSVNRVLVDNVDERYMTFRTRGLNTTQRPESPLHTAPVDQTWGLREFAATDPDGNNLCFCMPRGNCRIPLESNATELSPRLALGLLERGARQYVGLVTPARTNTQRTNPLLRPDPRPWDWWSRSGSTHSERVRRFHDQGQSVQPAGSAADW